MRVKILVIVAFALLLAFVSQSQAGLFKNSQVRAAGYGTTPPLVVDCTSGITSSCGCWTTTGASKVGTIAVNVNGTTRYINIYDANN